MKKIFAFIVALVLVFSCGASAFASSAVNGMSGEELYSEYQKLVDDANEQYGFALTLVSLEEIETRYTVEEFEKILNDYCQYKLESVITVETPQTITARGVGVVNVPCIIKKTHSNVTVTVTFTGGFDIRQNADGSYYIYDENYYDPVAKSSSSSLYYTINGSLSKRLIDSGRTRQISQTFDVWVNNVINDSVTVSAYYYFNSATGTVTASSN